MRWRFTHRRLLQAVAILAITAFFFPGCMSRGYIEPAEYKPEDHCDSDRMKLRDDIRDSDWIRYGDHKKSVGAYAECGSYTVTVLRKNTAAAKANRPDSLSEDLGEVGIGAIIASLIIAILKVAAL